MMTGRELYGKVKEILNSSTNTAANAIGGFGDFLSENSQSIVGTLGGIGVGGLLGGGVGQAIYGGYEDEDSKNKRLMLLAIGMGIGGANGLRIGSILKAQDTLAAQKAYQDEVEAMKRQWKQKNQAPSYSNDGSGNGGDVEQPLRYNPFDRRYDSELYPYSRHSNNSPPTNLDILRDRASRY